MKRIRISGNNKFDNANISCKTCNFVIIRNGEPMTPLYYVNNDGNHFCPRCSHYENVTYINT